MDADKIIEVANEHYTKLMTLGAVPIRNRDATTPEERKDHLAYMCTQIHVFVGEGRLGKANRWLGFVQGSLWCMGLHSIHDLREHNKPAEASDPT